MKVQIKKLKDEAVIPSYSKVGDAGMDLTAINKRITNTYIEYGTGIAVKIPSGYVGLIFPRSSISNTNMSLANSVGVIDCVPKGTLITLSNGENVPVETILQSDNDDLRNIMSFNEEENKFESDYINEIWTIDGHNIIELEDEDGNKIRLPETKQIYTSTGWKQVKDLIEGDLVLKYD